MSRIDKKSKGEKTYSVLVPLFAYTVIRVKADTPEQALERASDIASAPSLCHQCTKDCEMGEVDLDSLDLDCVCEVEE